jgi:hypothetical protein
MESHPFAKNAKEWGTRVEVVGRIPCGALAGFGGHAVLHARGRARLHFTGRPPRLVLDLYLGKTLSIFFMILSAH